MAYEPTIWECGDVVTAERLNHMEEGIQAANDCCEGGSGNEPLIVHLLEMTAEEITEAGLTGVEVGNARRLDTTTEVIYEAFSSGQTVLLIDENDTGRAAILFIQVVMGEDEQNQAFVGAQALASPSTYPYLIQVSGGGHA